MSWQLIWKNARSSLLPGKGGIKLSRNKPSIQIKGFNLPWDLPLLAGMPLQVAYFTLLLRRHQFRELINLVENSCSKSGHEQLETSNRLNAIEQTELDKVYRATTFVLQRILRSNKPCLRRSLITYRWCRRRGFEADIVIGVKKTDGKLESHAWLVIDGQPYQENVEELNKYTQITDSRSDK